jgi:hypothetical protein
MGIQSPARLNRDLAIVGVCAWLALAVAWPAYLGPWSKSIGPNFVLGTFCGSTTLSALWLVFGAAGYARRLWIWLLCGMATAAALTINAWMSGGLQNDGPMMCLIMGAVAMTQSALIAGVLWILGKATGARLRHLDELSSKVGGGDQQFGIGAVLTVTGIVAAVLGGMRLLLEWQTPRSNIVVHSTAFLGYFVLCNLFVALPFTITPLLRRFALTCTLVALVLVVGVTALQVSGYRQFDNHPGDGWNRFLPVNVIQVGWVLLALYFVRRAGYRLSAAIPASHRPEASAAQPT